MSSPDPVTIFATDTSSTTIKTTTRAAAVMADVFDLQTTEGTITVELFPADAPNHVSDFVKVATSGGYDSAPFYYVAGDGICVGSPSTQNVEQEPNDIAYVRGTVIGLEREDKGPDASAHFYIAFSDALSLDRQKNTVFGRVIAGMDVVDRIANTPVNGKHRPLKSITIIRASPRKHG
jgi:cyclophilin family peptidyl-prolyl cis-trans isomerase